MNDNVVNLADQRPHLAGKCICIACKHEWIATHPVPAEWVECPACHTHKGMFKYPIIRTNSMHWTCNCGNDLFYAVAEGMYCPHCGEWQNGF